MPTFSSQPIVKLRMVAWPKGYDVERASGFADRWQLIRISDRLAAQAPDGGTSFTTEEARQYLDARPRR